MSEAASLAIWKAPTGAEADDIVIALEEYIQFGDFPATRSNIYAWGEDEVRL
jgi:hypothetical protein